MTEMVLTSLAALIHSRRNDSASKSYTKELLDAGIERSAKKLGEEAVETVIAAMGTDKVALKKEAADLLYHLLVVLEHKGVALSEVLGELEARTGTSGLVEKAQRAAKTP